MSPARLPQLSASLALLLLGALPLVGCEEPRGAVPAASTAESYYAYRGELEASVEGGVVEIRASQPRDQLERGGALWARVGPYILLFSEETHRLFREHPGLAAVRAITRTPDGEEIARAYLPRNAMTGLTWPRALDLAARARTSGTDKPTLLEDLVQWGEDRTDFEYAPEFQRSRGR